MVGSYVKLSQFCSSYVGSVRASVLLTFSYVLGRCAALSREAAVIEMP